RLSNTAEIISGGGWRRPASNEAASAGIPRVFLPRSFLVWVLRFYSRAHDSDPPSSLCEGNIIAPASVSLYPAYFSSSNEIGKGSRNVRGLNEYSTDLKRVHNLLYRSRTVSPP